MKSLPKTAKKQHMHEDAELPHRMDGWKDLSTMKNIYIHTQQEDLEIAQRKLTAGKEAM